jgi:pimeloyl-ACP methyl ester carboxylesterase
MLPVVILHGWSDDSDSFEPLSGWLKKNGFNVVSIFLGDYLSMNDEITLLDLGSAFQKALLANKIQLKPHQFDLVVHSTGGLVAREFLRQVCQGDASKTPVAHLCMLAPANFGSPLATLGKSVLGRLMKGWSWKHMGQTGTQILNALELASPYSWGLAQEDLFEAGFKVFDPANTMATVLVGSSAYEGMRGVFHENGSDGTVRVATANLNAHYFKVDFDDPEAPTCTEQPRNVGEIALGVFQRNHTTIHDPDASLVQSQEWSDALIRALTMTPDQYGVHVQNLKDLTQTTFNSGTHGANSKWYHQYQHVVFRVHDQFGQPVEDYVIEFYQEKRDPEDKVFVKIHGEILEKVTTNSVDASYRSFFFDTTDLGTYLVENPQTDIVMSLSAARLSERVSYRNPKKGAIQVFSNTAQTFLHPNEPILIDVTLWRVTSDQVFKLRKV